MNFLEITINCIQQEDLTGADQLSFELNEFTIGHLYIRTGDTRTVRGASPLLYPSDGQGIFISEGDKLKIWEEDLLDPNDLLLDYTVSKTDIDAGSITIPYSNTNAQYEFTMTFI